MSQRRRRAAWSLGTALSLFAAAACDVALNPQPLPPAAAPDGGDFSSATVDSGGRKEPASDPDPNASVSDAAGGADGGLPPAPPLDDAGDAGADAARDADADAG